MPGVTGVTGVPGVTGVSGVPRVPWGDRSTRVDRSPVSGWANTRIDEL